MPNFIQKFNITTGDKISHQDASDPVKKSPLTGVGTTIVSITPPAKAVLAFLTSHADDIRIGDDASLANGYEVVPAGKWSLPIPCIAGQAIYVRIDAAAGTTTINFRFEEVT